METLHYTEEFRQELLKKSLDIDYHSNLSFLGSHNGLRRGSVHVVLGTPGGGKSTLIRSILRDFLLDSKNDKHTASIWLSEETCAEYKVQLMFGIATSDNLKRGVIISEEEHSKEKFDFFLRKQALVAPDLLVYDNLTTSRFYEGTTIKEQSEIFRKIKNLTKEINCATIIVAHTGAEINDSMDRLINPNDIRGSKTVINGCEFLYILQRFELAINGGPSFFPTIRIVKHRGQELVHNLYFLQYDRATRSFKADTPLQFDKFKEAYAQRKKLK